MGKKIYNIKDASNILDIIIDEIIEENNDYRINESELKTQFKIQKLINEIEGIEETK